MNNKFLRFSLPFFGLVFGGAFSLHFFQQVRYEFRRTKQQFDTKSDLEDSGLETKTTSLDQIYKEVAELDTENWENIRGPREHEDNKEYIEARKKQEEKRAKERQAPAQSNSQDSSEGGSRASSSGNGSPLAKALRPTRTHKMVFVANMGLKMGTGKLAAQVGHATLGVYQCAQRKKEGKAALNHWERHGAVKIVVKGQTTEQLIDLNKMAKELGLYTYLVQDAGYTQIPAGSRTVLGLFGVVEDVDKISGELKLL